MSAQKRTEAEARAFLELPNDLVAPESDMLVQDARATLLHNLTLHTEARETGVLVSPVWEKNGDQAALRAANVPPQIAARISKARA